jgi:hypothetical protein
MFNYEWAQIGSKVMQYSGRFTGEKTTFATTMGPQEAFTVAKITFCGFPASRGVQ